MAGALRGSPPFLNQGAEAGRAHMGTGSGRERSRLQVNSHRRCRHLQTPPHLHSRNFPFTTNISPPPPLFHLHLISNISTSHSPPSPLTFHLFHLIFHLYSIFTTNSSPPPPSVPLHNPYRASISSISPAKPTFHLHITSQPTPPPQLHNQHKHCTIIFKPL